MKLLVTGAAKFSKKQLDRLSDTNRVIYLQKESDALPLPYDEVEGVVCNGLFLHHDIRKFSSLRFIQLTSAGYDRVPVDYIVGQGIALFNAHGVYSIPISEFALCGVLSLYKQFVFFLDNKNKHVWEKHRNIYELFGKEVCIVGCGNIGTECAKRFSSMGCHIVGLDIKKIDNAAFDEIYSMDSLDDALSHCDICVVCVPQSESTFHLFDSNRFDLMKQNSVFVNISRGSVVDTQALVAALENKLFGAVIDVFENEPLDVNSLLWEKHNVILTPHNSFVGEGNSSRLFDLVVKNLINYKRG